MHKPRSYMAVGGMEGVVQRASLSAPLAGIK